MRQLLRRLAYLLRARRREADLAEELRFHRDMTERELRAGGLPAPVAAAAAGRRLGSDLLARDHARDVWLFPPLQGLAQDLRFVARLLWRERVFTLIAALTLALGIGGATTIFTITNGIVLRGLPAPRPERLLRISTADAHGRPVGVSLLDYEDWRGATKAFAEMAASHGGTANVTDTDRAPERFSGQFVSANMFRLLGERPVLGRDFLPADDRPGAPAVVIIGHRVWNGRYHADPRIIGRVIAINGTPAEVIGVMPEGFRFPVVHDIWQPLRQSPTLATAKRDDRTLEVIGRLAERVPLARAQAELDAIGARLAADHPDTNRGTRVQASSVTGRLEIDNPWTAMLGVVCFVLLIACANVANLLLARSAHRAREIAVRASLGASRWRIVRQLMAESLALALIAGLLGWGFAVAGIRWWTVATAGVNWPYWFVWTMDARVFLFMAGITLAAACLFGLAPALQMACTNPGEVMKAGGRGMRGSGTGRWSSGLLALELALTLVLLTGAGLMARSLAAVYRADAIVDTSGIHLASISLPPQKYPTPEQRTAFHARLAERLAAMPDVAATAVASTMPFYHAESRLLTIEGRAPTASAATSARDEGEALQASYVAISPGYFELLRLPMIGGRDFGDVDGTAGHETAIVNQQFARTYFAGGNPIGHRIRLSNPRKSGEPAPWLTVVGVSPTVRQHYAKDIDPVVYVPYRLAPQPYAVVFVRGRTASAPLAAQLRDGLRAIDPDLPSFDPFTLDGLQSMTMFVSQMYATIFAVFSAIALIVASVGLSAVTAYAVTQRTQEIGVRMALGARAPEVVWLFVRRALPALGLGLAFGLGGALAMGRIVRGMLVGVSATDPLTLISIGALLFVVTLAACALPARRAARLDPVKALRFD